ncbi:MAG: alpha/beta fold hydrolase, partial [Gaiellaceae bacterium]
MLGANDGCAMAALYAATYPERTRGLVLFMPAARHENADQLLADLPQLREGWGAQEYSDRMLAGSCPTLYASEADRRWFANWLRVGTSPAVAYALNRAWYETDIREVLPAIRVPTLVLARRDSPLAPVELVREAAELIPGARFAEIPG